MSAQAEPVESFAVLLINAGQQALRSDPDPEVRRQAAEAAEWLQQATLAIRARVPVEVLRDTIQPFPSFSEIHAFAVKALRREIARGGEAH